jgi:hypothetical protein
MTYTNYFLDVLNTGSCCVPDCHAAYDGDAASPLIHAYGDVP